MNHEPQRVAVCRVADRCGGCAWIGLEAAERLSRKADKVRAALGASSVEAALSALQPCVDAPAVWAYRNRAKFAVAADGTDVRIGLHRRGTAEPVDVGPCPVQTPATVEAIERVRRWLRDHRLAAPVGPVRHLDLREAAGARFHLTLVLALSPRQEPSLPLAALVDDWDACLGVSVNYQPRASSYTFGEVTRTLVGARGFPIDVSGPDGRRRSFEVPATGFFQVATGPLTEIHRRLARWIGTAPPGPLIDLYAGVGVHGIVLADVEAREGRRRKVLGIEVSAPASSCARRNAHRHGIDARYLRGPVEALWPNEAPAVDAAAVLLNPGRAGCRAPVLDAMPSAVAHLAYLSCDPQTLARDLGRLSSHGWRPTAITPFDLMPQTDQVETLAVLQR